MPSARTQWIWTDAALPARNAFLRFRRAFTASGALRIRITADSRYWLYVDGEYVGTGPVRSWPNHWKVDEYELPAPAGKTRHVVAVLVNHFGEGNFQYIPAPPGLLVEVRDAASAGVATDTAWRCSPSRANVSATPRISVQEGFEEQYDGRHDDGWTGTGYDDRRWPRAVAVAPPHGRLEPRGIPFLTREPVLPQRVLRAERVRPASHTWNLALKPYFAPHDTTSNFCLPKGFVFTQVWSKSAQTVEFVRPHHHACRFKVNGRLVPAIVRDMVTPLQRQPVRLRAGWNQVLVPFSDLKPDADEIDLRFGTHFPHFVLAVTADKPLRWAVRGEDGGAAWAFVGPFAYTEGEQAGVNTHRDAPHIVASGKALPGASAEAFVALWRRGTLDPRTLRARFVQPMSPGHAVAVDVAAGAMADHPDGPHQVLGAEALLGSGGAWAEIPPAKDGSDVRLLLDFGREVVGGHFLEVDAGPGTVIDFHNFEFIQADGAENLADGMNNALRFTCKGGLQRFRSLQRRGFQYSWLIARNLRSPLRVRRLGVEFATYPQARRGSFLSSDAKLNRIWEVGAHTLRCCSEDTYTDCPTYEQTHWVGDARNEALIDWAVNGDPRLWFRCVEQVGQSLERSAISLSNVPAAWTNVLPAWSSLWMRSCSEYLLWTGDREGGARLLRWVERNADGIEKHLNARGLFEIRAWNMFDWADMDTPDTGVVTHNNCFMVLALRDCARMADWLGRPAVARRFRATASRMAAAINRWLWDPRRRAYVDSVHADGVVSTVFSQQTQTAALMAGVATGARERRCRDIVHRPPEGFVRAGSPFFEFFLLEVLATEGRTREFLDVIRSDWGFMIDQGATTFWEMWSVKTGRLTRSHCHGWSAAPTFFLATEILGVRPLKPGFAECTVTPRLGGLDFVRGAVPTPRGPIRVSCERKGSRVKTTIELPKGVRLVKA
jgi:alpha-L-rhamnosidase